MNRFKSLTLALMLSLTPLTATQATTPGKSVTAAEQAAVIDALASQLDANYVFPELAQRVGATLRTKVRNGDYAGAKTAEALAEALTRDLQALARDGHFQVRYAPEFQSPPKRESPLPSAEDIANAQREAGEMAYGLGRIERLSGNVGYLEVRGFGPTELVSAQVTAAMSLLSGSDALILDLRRNHGGSPSTVAHLMSHFFPHGDERHLNDIYSRPDDSTQQYWTNTAVEVRYDKPVYVLTSKETFSGGEECAYDFQTQKRGTLVGETTGGASNPGDIFPLAKGFAAFIPTGKAINPVTKTNWEHVGVKPDIAVTAAQAQDVAHKAILRSLLDEAKDSERREELKHALAALEKPAAVADLR